MIHPEKEFVSVVIRDEDRLLLARQGSRLDFIGSELQPGIEQKDLAEQALREIAHIGLEDLTPSGMIDDLVPPITRHHMFKGSKIIGRPVGAGGVAVDWYVPHRIRGLGLTVSFALSAVIYQLNRH